MFRRFVLILVLLIPLTDGQLWGKNGGTEKEKTQTQEVEQVMGQLNRLESVASGAIRTLQMAAPLIKSAAAVALLKHGPRMQNTVLVLQALKMSGLPEITKAVQALRDTYIKSRDKLIQDLPTLIAAKSEAEGLASKLRGLKTSLTELALKSKKELEMLERSFKSGGGVGIASKEQLEKKKSQLIATYDKERSKISTQVDELYNSRNKIDAAGNALKAILSSTEPELLNDIATRTYSAMLSTVTVAKSKTAQTVSIGLNFGQTVFDRAVKIFLAEHRLVKVGGGGGGATWLATVLRSASSALGVLLASMLNRAAITLSACSLGSEVLVAELGFALDSAAKKFGLEAPSKLTIWPALITGIQGALVAFAAFGHLMGGIFAPASAAAVARKEKGGKLIDPFIALEKLVTSLLFDGKMSA